MEKFKATLKARIRIYAIFTAVLLAVQVLACVGVISPAAGDSHWNDMWNGIIAGASFGIMALFVVCIVNNILAMKDEKRLKKMYAEENDERTKMIYTDARSAGAMIFLIGGLVAGIIAGYFSIAVCFTILACVFAHSIICGAMKIYYSRKY